MYKSTFVDETLSLVPGGRQAAEMKALEKCHSLNDAAYFK
jgi:hypothetical protein